MTDPAARARSEIVDLLPHGEALCLIERVCEQTPDRIRCKARGPAAEEHPLRHEGRLASVNAVELAAQAAAIHGALSRDGSARRGMIASIPRISWSHGAFSAEAATLDVSCVRVSADSHYSAYDFSVDDSLGVTVQGEVILVFGNPDT